MGIDKELHSAYQRTRYEVREPHFSIREGALHPELDRWLMDLGYAEWAFITAWNPGSRPLPRLKNEKRQSDLARRVQEGGWISFPAAGIPEVDGWEAEESLFIAGIPLEDAIRLGRKYGQNAILWGGIRGTAKFFYCFEPPFEPKDQ